MENLNGRLRKISPSKKLAICCNLFLHYQPQGLPWLGNLGVAWPKGHLISMRIGNLLGKLTSCQWWAEHRRYGLQLPTKSLKVGFYQNHKQIDQPGDAAFTAIQFLHGTNPWSSTFHCEIYHRLSREVAATGSGQASALSLVLSPSESSTVRGSFIYKETTGHNKKESCSKKRKETTVLSFQFLPFVESLCNCTDLYWRRVRHPRILQTARCWIGNSHRHCFLSRMHCQNYEVVSATFMWGWIKE